jgi:hypothetical protein
VTRVRALLLCALVAAALLGTAAPAAACSCAGPPTASELAGRGALAYVGDVRVASSSDSRATYDVTVVEPLVGDPGERRHVVDELESRGSCGDRVLEPARYLVVEHRPGRISTACYGPQPSDVDSDMVMALRAVAAVEGATPRAVADPGRGPAPPLGTALVAAALAALAAWVAPRLVARRRRS